MGEQRGDQLLLLDLAGFGFKHQPHHGVFVGLVAHAIQHRQDAGLELGLVQTQRFLAVFDLGVGDFLNLFQHLLRADAGGQFIDHQLPLAARQLFNLPARPHLERAATGAISLSDVSCAADDLAAAGEIGAWNQRAQFFIAQLGVFDQRNAGIGNLAQVVARDFGRQTDRNAAGTVEQSERQTRRQLARFFGAAVVVGDKINRALVDFVHQQAGDSSQARLGVAHGGSAVAVAGAKVTLPVDERVAL